MTYQPEQTVKHPCAERRGCLPRVLILDAAGIQFMLILDAAGIQFMLILDAVGIQFGC